jgi:hypothetical protein
MLECFHVNLQAYGYYTPQFENSIADGCKMAAARQEHNRNARFSTTLPINVHMSHKQAVQVRRDKVYTSLPLNNEETKKRLPGLRREVLRVRSRIVL